MIFILKKVYYFEKGLNILKEKGIFAFICSNKFAKAKYGEKLRKLILENQLKIYDDFTGVKIFKEAQVDTCIIQLKKEHNESNEIFVNHDYYLKQNRLENNSFLFNPPEILDLKDKIINQGAMIKNLDITIKRGILTGFNKAFIIDEVTKNKLIEKDYKNKEVIKPLLRGRDIQKWSIKYQNLYLLYIPWNFNIQKYPSLKDYLQNYKEDLSNRPEVKKERYNWYCLSRYASDYVDLFEKEKLIYPELSSSLSMVYDNKKYYIDKTCFIITTSLNIKYIYALLNSNVLNFAFKLLGTPLGKSGFNLSKIYIEQLPIKITNATIEDNVVDIVEKIIILNKEIDNEIINFKKFLKKQNFNTNLNKINEYYFLDSKKFIKEIKKQRDVLLTDKLINELNREFQNNINRISNLNSEIKLKENELNNIIYKIYNLNENEIKLIEENLY